MPDSFQNAKDFLNSVPGCWVLPAAADYEVPFYIYDGLGCGFFMNSWPEYRKFSTFDPLEIDRWPKGLEDCYLIDLKRSGLVALEFMDTPGNEKQFEKFLSEWGIEFNPKFVIEGAENIFYVFRSDKDYKNFSGLKWKDGTPFTAVTLQKDFIPGPDTCFLDGAYSYPKEGYQPEITDFPFESCLLELQGPEIQDRFESVVLSDVKPEKINWLWYNKIPLGMVTVLAGYGGEGKSYFSAYLAAELSKGDGWPDGSPCPLGGTVFFPGEDPIEQVFKPRLETLGADTRLISVYQGAKTEFEIYNKETKKNERKEIFSEAGLNDLKSLKQFLHYERKRTGTAVKLLVIDPVTNFLGDTKENSNSEIRQLLSPLCELAREENIAVLLISHFKKGGSEDNSAGRVLGSVAFTTIARAVWFLYADKEDRNLKSVVFAKGNILVNPSGIEFRILPNGTLEFTNTELAKTAEDIEIEQFRQRRKEEQKALSEVKEETRTRNRGPKAEKRQAAEKWLIDQLKAYPNGIEVKELKEEAKDAGFSWATIQRAANNIDVHREKLLTGWYWSTTFQDT
ncbi:MAG: AAA family ATPase [Planctomycetia bacterium]|nr:AAA family ATPase [Planctomycetia bacterium]